MKLLLHDQLNPRKPLRQLAVDRDYCRLLFVIAGVANFLLWQPVGLSNALPT